MFSCPLCGYSPHIDRFYDSRHSEHRAVLMFERSSWGSRQVAQMGFDGRVAGWTVPRVRRRPLSCLYCPVQTPWGLITGGGGVREGEAVSLCHCGTGKDRGVFSSYQCEGTSGNSPLIHWLNQSRANMRASSRVKARHVWFHHTDSMVSSAKATASRADRSGNSWSSTQLPKQAVLLMPLVVQKVPELHLHV